MLKKLLLCVMVLLLIGCSNTQDYDKLEASLYKANEEIKLLTEENDLLEASIEELRLSIEKLDDASRTKDAKIRNMNQEIEALQVNEHTHRNTLGEVYNDYLTMFAYDVIRDLENYEMLSGVIANYDKETGRIDFYIAEFVAYYDNERIEELKIDTTASNPIAGSYIYLHKDKTVSYELSENFKFYLIDWDKHADLKERSLEDYLKEYPESQTLFKIDIVNNKVIRFMEYFLD
ncbi:hypothetical protein EZV73_01575 [Acidaminobacter sp. JC074]|uniref:hypothetical protein n=1 Tax=Acidaminobacter sp. JC074 TaxID=2530199 RepID=UPI001F10FABB|nr:hypothetical protein [Acidaminobacter sp. JC074]MCH4886234.1 hypothetical protein [Acidaminobacter sp. JC074]